MGTIRLQTNQHRLIQNLRHAFSQSSMLGELLQNARRAKAQNIFIEVDETSIAITDDGIGIADLQSLIFIAESGWDQETQQKENPFGMGVLATLYFAQRLSVYSGSQRFSATTADIIAGKDVPTQTVTSRYGTLIQLDGVEAPIKNMSLPLWTKNEVQRLCVGFPVPVWFNGEAVARPLADRNLPWIATSEGDVLIDLQAAPSSWRSFLQGLPIGRQPVSSHHQIIHLRDDMIAKLPDRLHLLNEEQDHPTIQAAIDHAYRQTLIEAKQRLAASEFVELYADTCVHSANDDLLNDIPFVPHAWFRNWADEPPGYRRYWDRYPAGGIVSQEALRETGVWKIESEAEDEETSTAETYLAARQAFLLEIHRIDAGHWLRAMVQTIRSSQVMVHHGTILHTEVNPPLADYPLELALAETLHVVLEGEADTYEVDAVRKGSMLFLTAGADNPTKLVSDYMSDDRYEEDREEEDAQTLATFIAVGCSHGPAEVVRALLPNALGYQPQPKLASATVQLVFDDCGKLQDIKV